MSKNSSSGIALKGITTLNTMPSVVSLPNGSASAISLTSGSRNNTLMLMNKQVTADDSLYYICLKLRRRLENITQLKPYLNLAYSTAEVSSENQALALSQKSANSSNHQSYSSTTSLRISTLSSFSNLSEDSSSNSTTTEQVGNIPLNTFHAGVLPAPVNCDPVTQLWALFQQGSPLCVIFNIIKPAYSLPVIASDDLKTCKKSIYDFLSACKNYLDFENSELFPVTDVFSNDSENLIKVIKVLNRVIDMAPTIFKPITIDEEFPVTDKKSKILKELVETERKYVNDLEILVQYKKQLLEYNIISSDNLYMLFPNLDKVLDFQRKVLVSLEINALVDPKYRRIGSIFVHAQPYFKLYEPWSIGQKAAIDFINASPLKNRNCDLIIVNEFELQSFLLKPVQRLCKYPMLLKELVKSTEPTSPNYNELQLALDISKKTANDINENQRRVENVEVLKSLYDKVADWKGYNLNSFGELLFFDKVIVKDNSKTSEEREFQVYLFENIIIFFKELVPQQKKSSIGLKKKSQTNLLASTRENNGFELKGRISIANIYSITMVNPHLLNISWSGTKDTGSFLMKFKNEEVRTNWEQCIRKLVATLQDDYSNTNSTINGVPHSDRRSNGLSLNSNRSSYIDRNSTTTTPASATSMDSKNAQYFHQKQKSEVGVNSGAGTSNSHKRATQDSIQSKRSISDSYKNSLPNNSIIVKLTHEKDLFTLMTSLDVHVDEFLAKVEKKIRQTGGEMVGKVKYRDEDGDFLLIQTEEDWALIREAMKLAGEKVLNVWA